MREIFLGAVAGLLVLTACSTVGPPRAYFNEDVSARYYSTQSGRILRVDSDGMVLNVTCHPPSLVRGFPRQEFPKPPCEGGLDGVLGKTRKIGEDWDMTSYDIAPETGTCKSLFPFFRNEWLEDKRHSCWHRVWEVPAAVVFYPSFAIVVIGVITSPIWVPLLFL